MTTRKPNWSTEGICPTCADGVGCERYAKSTTAVHACERFAVEHAPTPELVSEATGTDVATAPDLAMGLCRNCDHRENCSLSQQEGGIWNCEEYE